MSRIIAEDSLDHYKSNDWYDKENDEDEEEQLEEHNSDFEEENELIGRENYYYPTTTEQLEQLEEDTFLEQHGETIEFIEDVKKPVEVAVNFATNKKGGKKNKKNKKINEFEKNESANGGDNKEENVVKSEVRYLNPEEFYEHDPKMLARYKVKYRGNELFWKSSPSSSNDGTSGGNNNIKIANINFCATDYYKEYQKTGIAKLRPVNQIIKEEKEESIITYSSPLNYVNLTLDHIAMDVNLNKLYLFGGSKHGKFYNHFLTYNLENKVWTDVRGKMLKLSNGNCKLPPPMKHPFLACMPYFNFIVLISLDPENVWILNKPFSGGNQVETSSWLNFSASTLSHGSSYIDPIENYACTKFERDKIVVFGGRNTRTKKLSKDMIIYTVGHGCYPVRTIVNDVTGDIPSAREGHGICGVGSFIYLFGGMNEYGYILNDLYCFHVDRKTWFSIEPNITLPPLRNMSMTLHFNQFIVIYGGIKGSHTDNNNDENTISNEIYRIYPSSGSVGLQRLEAINITGPYTDTDYTDINEIKPKLLQVPRVYHTAVANGKDLYIVGGTNDISTGKSFKDGLIITDIHENGKVNSLCEYLKNIFEKSQLGNLEDGTLNIDAVIKVVDEKTHQTDLIYCHKSLLTARSKTLFTSIFSNKEVGEFASFVETIEVNNEFGLRFIDVYNITLENIYFKSLYTYIKYLYTGNLIYRENNSQVIEQIKKLALIDNDELITSLFENKIDVISINIYNDSLNNLKNDLNTIFEESIRMIDNFSEESSIENHFAEVTAQLLDPNANIDSAEVDSNENIILHSLKVHKLFLFRSSFIEKVFSAGMEETINNIIKFDHISFNGLVCILRYLYTNEIIIPLESCIEIFIISLHFQLNELTVYCRHMVSKGLNIENVIDVCNLVYEIFHDPQLLAACESFILKNHDVLHLTPKYLNLVPPLKKEIESRVIEMKIRQLKKKRKDLINKEKKGENN
ncbi:hypothetical protein ABK040_002307 [Willaertia magna]